jgi:DNA-3-methyladenine glycosylase I
MWFKIRYLHFLSYTENPFLKFKLFMDDKIRCTWCLSSNLYKKYHDEEWGVPVFDDAILFEFLILETFQAGLSWITILNKRENFRRAFDQFDFNKIAQYNEEKVQELMLDKGIIRNQLKIRAAVNNAIVFLKVRKEFGSFSNYFWAFSDGKVIQGQRKSLTEIPATSALSDLISKDLKSRGFKFVGSTVVYAKMQAIGMVNDHLEDCWRRNPC